VRGVRLAANIRNPQALDVTFDVEPRPVFRYSLAGGVNALEGLSLTGMIGTVNAFGRGERLYASAQYGEKVGAFDVAASRPYAFGTPWTLSGEARRDRLDYDAVPDALPAYSRDEWSLRAQADRPLSARSTLWVAASFADVSLETTEASEPPAGFGRRQQGALSGSLRFDGWDHPWKPRRGLRASAWSLGSAGTYDYLKVRARTSAFAPLGARAALGASVETGWLRGFGSATLPFDERYLLGGENDLRGFDARSVGPTDASGTLVGGTRYAVASAELHVDVTRWLRTLAFVDGGQAWEPGDRGRWLVSSGFEARFAVPIVRLPIRLIYAWNPEREAFHPRSKFRVAIGVLP